MALAAGAVRRIILFNGIITNNSRSVVLVQNVRLLSTTSIRKRKYTVKINTTLDTVKLGYVRMCDDMTLLNIIIVMININLFIGTCWGEISD